MIAGDNLFGFSLGNFVKFFKEKNNSVVAFYDLKDKEKVKRKFGVGMLEGSKIVNFEEKIIEPKSSLASTACYLFSKNNLYLVEKAIEQGYADNSGDLIRYLVNNSEAHGFVFDQHWFDIGTPESLKEAEEAFGKK